MNKPYIFEKPVGMRDVLPKMVTHKYKLQQKIFSLLKAWGYQPIETPTLEYYESVGVFSAMLENRMFKLLEPSGKTLFLRSDLTIPIARVVASVLKEEPFPLRLAYSGNVFRAQENEAGKNAEYPEIGIELIGQQVPDADAEVITLMYKTLQEANLFNYKITVGHIGFVQAIFEECLENEIEKKQLLECLLLKDYVAYERMVNQSYISKDNKRILLALLDMRGDIQQIRNAAQLQIGPKATQSLADLDQIWEVLEIYGVTAKINFDLCLVSNLDYYTGVIFEAYMEKVGSLIGSGGRYDTLLEHFGRPAPAIGFSLKLDPILEASQRLLEEEDEHVLIIYSEDQRLKAINLAQKYRAQGTQVSLFLPPTVEILDKELYQKSMYTTYIFLYEKGESDVLKSR